MAEKRAATSELNHLNWNKDEEPEQSGTFQTASADELKDRVIKKARRKIGSEQGEQQKTVFSGFSGFKSTASASTISSTSSPFSFLSKINSTTSTSSGPLNNGANFKSSEIGVKENHESIGFDGSKMKNGAHKLVKDYSKLKGLNEAIVNWIKKHVDENPICILTPIFKDYENYIKDIMEDEKGTTENANKKDDKSERTSQLFSMASKDSKTISKNEENKLSVDGNKGIFGQNSNKEPQKSDTGSIFANAKPMTSNIFGSSASSGFQFGNKTETPSNTTIASPSTGFSFTNSKPFSFGGSVAGNAPAAESGPVEDEDSEEPPKNDFKAVVEEDSVYSKRCKVFVKHDNVFADRGVGTLYLKPVKDSDKTQLLVRADTNLGNILLNFILSDGLPSQRTGKNNVMMVCIPTPESEQKPTSVLLRVKTGEEADQLLEEINKYKK